jgi:hypothetical protein
MLEGPDCPFETPITMGDNSAAGLDRAAGADDIVPQKFSKRTAREAATAK